MLRVNGNTVTKNSIFFRPYALPFVRSWAPSYARYATPFREKDYAVCSFYIHVL